MKTGIIMKSNLSKRIWNIKYISKIILSVCFIFSITPVYSQYESRVKDYISTSVFFDGHWSNWLDESPKVRIRGGWAVMTIQGDYSGFIVYYEDEGPWNHFFKFTIDNYQKPDSKTMRRHRKKELWYEYKGTVEYYICDDYPRIYDLFKERKSMEFIPKTMANGRPTKKVKMPATIKIAPYKKRPKVYNIWFDKVGLAIHLNDLYFAE